MRKTRKLAGINAKAKITQIAVNISIAIRFSISLSSWISDFGTGWLIAVIPYSATDCEGFFCNIRPRSNPLFKIFRNATLDVHPLLLYQTWEREKFSQNTILKISFPRVRWTLTVACAGNIRKSAATLAALTAESDGFVWLTRPTIWLINVSLRTSKLFTVFDWRNAMPPKRFIKYSSWSSVFNTLRNSNRSEVADRRDWSPTNQ